MQMQQQQLVQCQMKQQLLVAVMQLVVVVVVGLAMQIYVLCMRPACGGSSSTTRAQKVPGDISGWWCG
jgi:hypothetical protein